MVPKGTRMYKKVKAPSKTFRLIPTQYPPIQAFDDVASEADLEIVMALEGWTNDRLVKHRLQRLPKEDWVFGISNSSVIMAAFLHAPVNGLRFNNGDLGAWYCSAHLKTAIAEVATHLRREARNSNLNEIRSKYRSYDTKLQGKYLDIRNQQSLLPALYQKDNWYQSQLFGEEQRASNNDGIFYSSVRYEGGSNIVVFKPKLIEEVTVANSFDIIVPISGKIVAMELA